MVLKAQTDRQGDGKAKGAHSSTTSTDCQYIVAGKILELRLTSEDLRLNGHGLHASYDGWGGGGSKSISSGGFN